MTQRAGVEQSTSARFFAIDGVHHLMYTIEMKKRDLEKRLKVFGWELLRQGGSHEVWTNGEITEPVPRHKEVNERLANKILRIASENPRK